MHLFRQIPRWALCLSGLVLLTSCGEPELNGSDESMLHTFRRKQASLSRLMEMAQEDQAEVLWFTTHELQPSDKLLPEERWQEYDQARENTGVRRLARSENGIEMDVGTSSNSFMEEGAVKGFLFSFKPLQPVAESLDHGIPPAMAQAGAHVLYRKLATNWYLVFRKE